METVTSSASSVDSKLRIGLAKQGCRQTLGELLNEARGYLHFVATRAIDSDCRGRLSASDLVQETMADANRSFNEFRGEDCRQLMAWLRRILVNNVLNHYRSLRGTKKRDIRREKPVDLDRLSTEPNETPSAIAIGHEEDAVVAEELAKLAENYRQVIELRHRDGLDFVQISARLGKTSDATRMLWYRAFDQLSKAVERRLG